MNFHHRARAVALALASLAAAAAQATPESEVQTVLSSSTWSAEQGKTWDRSTDNTIVQIVHTPMDAWGRNPLTLSYNVYDHSGSAGSAFDLNTNLDDGSDMRVCGAPTAVNVKDPACGTTNAPPMVVNQQIARCQAYNIWRRLPADAVVSRCGAQSDKMLDDVWRLVSAAQQQVDVTTLFDPSGRFKTALRNAIHYAANQRVGQAGTLTVRVLVGEQMAPPWSKSALSSVQNMLPAQLADLQ